MTAGPLAWRALSARACTLEVRAQPNSRASAVVGAWNGKLKIAVRAPPQDGRANDELVEVLADALGLKRGDLQVIAGEKSREKRVALALPVDEARRRLQEHLSAE